MRFRLALGFILILSCAAFAQSQKERGLTIREINVYLSPDSTSAKLATLTRGREVVVLEKTGTNWLNVFASVTDGQEDITGERTPGRDVTGWIRDNGIIRTGSQNGDKVVFGEAVDSEWQASHRGGRRRADQDAFNLYRRMAEYWPQSPLAGEALYRAADIKWQIDRAAVMSRPSAKQRDPMLRAEIDEQLMRQVMKKFPHTKWDDMAAFHLIDNKVCGDWQGSSKCPEKEAELYEKYAESRPNSPSAPEALYSAAWRRAALIAMYPTEGKRDRVADAKSRAIALTQRIIANYADKTDWVTRAQALLFKLEHDVPTYGSPND